MSSPGRGELILEDLHAKVTGRPIPRRVDLRVRSGQVLSVIGPNGSGKTPPSHVLMGRRATG